MACWVKAQSAILRLFLAMRIFLVLTALPKPFSNCCWKPAKIDVCTDGLNKFAAELEDVRVLSQKAKNVVPVWKPCAYCVLKVEVCNVNLASAESPVPVPEVRGLLTGMLRSSSVIVEVITGSKFKRGLFAVEPPNTAPGVPPPNPPAFALRIPVSANHGLYRWTTMSMLFSSASSTASWRLN